MSVHLTCGMRRMSALDLLRGLVEGNPDATAPAVDRKGRPRVGPYCALDLSDAAIESAFARWRAKSKPLNESGTLGVWSAIRHGFEGWRVSAPAGGGLVFVDADDLDREHEVGLSACGAAFALDRRWIEPYEALIEGQELLPEELRALVPGADPDECASWIMELGGRSVVTLEPADA